ncbi:MAG TPA: lectin like domain-containing protein, partial [Gemmataceae bacterium]|nr:lectin like domain-containing protein [Gemmataceae bacterium]
MNRRLAALVFGSFLTASFFAMPAWTQQTTPPTAQPVAGALPATYDLRTVNAVTPIKKQSGGTCWTHGTMASIESHLLLSGTWQKLGMTGIPKCSEYHLDWWNGFNKEFNEDTKDTARGMTVHQGGDYKVAAAYISRGDGVVILPEGVAQTGWYSKKPEKTDPAYKKLYVRDVEFFTMGNNLEGIELIKKQVMKYGAMGTANAHGRNNKDNIHYQPIDSAGDPNHSIAIIGWDDNKYYKEAPAAGDLGKTRAPKPGAWLIKNSHGETAGEKGYHWISYYDKHSARHPEMGAVTFRNIEWLTYDHIYYHDAHGWRDTLSQVSKGFNAFKATGRETMKAVSFYTSVHNVNYTLEVFRKFENGQLSDKVVSQTGSIPFTGYHTVDLQAPVKLKENDMFYVCVTLSNGGHAIDRTSNIPVLLDDQQPPPDQKGGVQPPPDQKKNDQPPPKKGMQGGGKGGGKPIVISTAKPGESFYHDGKEWKDLYDY